MPRVKTEVGVDVERESEVKRPWEKAAERKSDSFPMISEFEKEDMDEVRALLESDQECKEQAEAAETTRRQIKTRLGELTVKYGVGGMRWDSMTVYDNGMVAKESLSPEALIEDGVPAEVVARAYRKGKEYRDIQIRDSIRKPK